MARFEIWTFYALGYIQPVGIVESWSLCPEDESWTQRKPEHGKSYYEYVKNYENLQTTFNPVQFNPQKWADAAKKQV